MYHSSGLNWDWQEGSDLAQWAGSQVVVDKCIKNYL